MDLISVKSRTGMLLTLGNIPIFWTSKIQLEIAPSSLEEMELVYARRFMFKSGKKMKYDLQSMTHVSKVWEDNTCIHNLANSKGPLMSSQAKHICIKYHRFLSMIKTLVIILLRISTRK